MSKNVAYLRVSTADQDLEKNKAEIWIQLYKSANFLSKND